MTGQQGDWQNSRSSYSTFNEGNSYFCTIIGDVYGELLSQVPAITAECSLVKPKHNIVHRIPTQGGPVYCKLRILLPEAFTVAKATFEKLLEDGVISRSTSSWCSPLHLVTKKDFSWHQLGDFRRLNNLTDRDTYPLPHIRSFADHLNGMKLYSKVDLKDAFFQIPVHPSDIAKTTITTPFGTYHYNYMPFGLSGAAQTFQRFIDTVMRDLTTDSRRVVTAFAYVDDILIASRDEKTHLEDLRALFQRLEQYGLRISPLKSLFGQDSIEFLGHSTTMEGVAPLPKKVSAMRSFS